MNVLQSDFKLDPLLRLILVSPSLTAGLAAKSIIGSDAVKEPEAVKQSSRIDDLEQQDESTSDVGTREFDDKNHVVPGSSVHKGENKWQCNECDKAFRYKSELDRHFLTHSGIKNFKCVQCGKRFRRKSHLTTHMPTHRTVKDFECIICGKKFTDKSNLARHTVTHSGIKNHECLECGRRFSRKSHLTRHSRLHRDA